MTGTEQLRTYQDAVAVVTGGASGIGLAIGKALSSRGAHVLLADRQADLARKHAKQIGGSAADLDVRDPAAVTELIQQTHGKMGRLDYLFNNAGIGVVGEVRNYDQSAWNDTLDVNLRGVTHAIQATYPLMIQQGFGHIVNTASMAGLMPMPFCASYCASKHAVIGLSLSLRIEAARLGVQISALCPGLIHTPILDGGGRFGRLLEPVAEQQLRRLVSRLGPMDPDLFARRVLRAVAKNQAIIVVPGWWRLLWWIQRRSPSLSCWLVAKQFARFKEQFESAAGAE